MSLKYLPKSHRTDKIGEIGALNQLVDKLQHELSTINQAILYSPKMPFIEIRTQLCTQIHLAKEKIARLKYPSTVSVADYNVSLPGRNTRVRTTN